MRISASASRSGSRSVGIAKTKMPDLNANDIEAAKKIIAGTAQNMGVEIETV